MMDPRDEAATACMPVQPAKAIITEVAAKHGLRVEDLCGPSRKWRVSRPRHEAMHTVRARLNMSLTAIGRAFGGRDHKTVLEGIRSHEGRTMGASNGH